MSTRTGQRPGSPTRPASGSARARARAGAAAGAQVGLAELAARLTARDRWIARMLAEHRVLTTTHLSALAFPSPRAAQLRLATLRHLGVTDSFRPLTTRGSGSAPTHWVLGVLGAEVLAAQDGLDPPTGHYRRRRAERLAIAHSHQLRHLLGVNTALITLTSNREGGCAHTGAGDRWDVWWSAARCARAVGDYVHPDAYARLSAPTRHPRRSGGSGGGGPDRLGFWFEYDTGTETLTQLATKVFGYHDLAATAATIPVLIWLPSRTRENNARTALAETLAALPQPELVPLATTSPGPGGPGLAGAVWLPLAGHQPRRMSITELTGCWPRLTDPILAEDTVLAAHADRGVTTARNRAHHAPASSWSSRLAAPAPTPPPTTLSPPRH